MTHVHSIYDTDLHFIIDPISRKITSESGKITLMQKDHNSERFTFQIPRYVEGHDMSLTNQVQVHYINLETVSPKRKHADMYPVLDLQVSPDSEDTVCFSWLISGNATQYVGSLNFLIRFVCYDDNSEIEYQWWSDTFTLIKIGATFDNTDSAVDLDNTDILESWRQECIQAVFESEVFSTLEAQGTNYIEQAKSYANQAKEISGLSTVQPLLDNIQTTGTATLSAAGWYRIAEYNSDKESSAYGAGSNMCDLVIKRGYSNVQSEFHVLRFRSVYKNQNFISLDDTSVGHLITKARHVVDTSDYKTYIEVYYNSDTSNGFFCLVESGKDRNRLWSAIPPTLTSETVDGVTVTTTYDIPANASPVTDLDLAQVDGTITLNTSILEKALTLEQGIYNFKLGGNSYSGNDLPHVSYKYGNATVFVHGKNSNVLVVLWGTSHSSTPIATQFYNGNDEAWRSDWSFSATTADLAKYLPLTGGDMKGALVFNYNGHNVYFQNTTDGRFVMRDDTAQNTIIEAPKTGKPTFNGTATGNVPLDGSIDNFNPVSDLNNFATGMATFYNTTNAPSSGWWFIISGGQKNSTISQIAFDLLQNTGPKQRRCASGKWSEWEDAKSNCLPLTGGKLSGTSGTVLSLENTAAAASFLQFLGKHGVSGYVGFDYADHLIIKKADSATTHEILHTGNMTSRVLPLNGGGLITADGSTPVRLKNTSGNRLYIQCLGPDDTNLGYLGFADKDRPVFVGSDASTIRNLHHSGNSAKTAIQEAAPTADANTLWVW